MDLKDHWTCIPTSKLIQSYKRFPVLWDSASKDYKNKSVRMECLQSIAHEMSQVKAGTTVSDIRAKLNNLRTQFGKEKHRRNEALQKGMVYTPKLWCYEEFKFIEGKAEDKHKSQVDKTDIVETRNKYSSNCSSIKKFEQCRARKFPKWSKNQTLTLIRHLKNYPLLYDRSHPLYSKPIHRALTANKLLSKLKLCRPDATLADMKSKINNFRDQRQKEKRKQQASMERTGRSNYKPKLWCFDELMFLDEKGQYSKNKPEELQLIEEPDDCYIEENDNEIYVKSFDDSDAEDMINITPSQQPLLTQGDTQDKKSRSILHKKCLSLVVSLTKQMTNLQRTHYSNDNCQTPQAALGKMVELELLKVSDDIFQDTKWKIIKLLEEASRRNEATISHR